MHLAGYEITWAATQHGDRLALSFGLSFAPFTR